MRRKIITNDRYLHEIADDAWKVVLLVSTEPEMYLRGLEVVELRRDADGRIGVVTVTRDALRDTLDRAADFVKEFEDKGKKKYVPSSPPIPVVAHMLAHPHPQIPVLKSVVEAPVFSAAGQLLKRQGYKRSARIYVDLPESFDMRPVPGNPTRRQVELALAELLEVLKDFPFVTEVDLANAVAFLILHFIRDMVGDTPLHVIESPTEGTGKDYLVDVVSIITTGRRSTVLSPPRDEAEMRRILTAMFMSGSPRLHLNNVDKLDSPALAAALTSKEWQDRVVGSSRNVRASIACTWVATGINPRLSREIGRRAVPIRLDAGIELADRHFSVPDLLGAVLSKRWQLVRDVLILVQAWIAVGCPPGTAKFLGYTAYARVLGGILENAGLQDFLTNRDRAFQTPDPERDELEYFILRWSEAYGGAVVNTGDLFELAVREELLPTIFEPGLPPASCRTRLGKLLPKHRDEVIMGCRLVSVGKDKHTHATKWRLEQITDAKGAKGAKGTKGGHTTEVEMWDTTGIVRVPGGEVPSHPSQFSQRRHSINVETVADLLTRAGDFGARFRVSEGRIEVLALHTLPKDVVKDLKANAAAIQAYLVETEDVSPWSEQGSVLLAWSAAAAELDLKTTVPVTFKPPAARTVETRRVGLYTAGYLTRLARIRMGRSSRIPDPPWTRSGP